jgi:FKBP-type peptidyl-prolyl cis-trans isomerase
LQNLGLVAARRTLARSDPTTSVLQTASKKVFGRDPIDDSIGAPQRYSIRSFSMKLGHLAIIGAFATLIIPGCAEPGGIVSVSPPGATPPKVSPDADPSQAIGEVAASSGATPAKPADTAKTAETKPGEEVKLVSAPSKDDAKLKTSPKGVKYEILKEGSGPEAKAGDHVQMHYTGTLENGTQFDSSRKPGREPFPVVLGAGQVIKGWDDGIPGMKVGERRKLIIPSELGYGARGYPPDIPAGATLIFDVELLKIGS